MATILTRSELKTYIYKELGCEYRKVEVSDTQLTNIIDDVIQEYSQFAHDGVTRHFYLLDIVDGTQSYEINDTGDYDIYSVVRIITKQKYGQYLTNYNMDDESVLLNQLYSAQPSMRMFDYYLANGYLESNDKLFIIKKSFEWNEHTKTFTLHEIPSANETIALDIYAYQTETNLFNINWIKRMCVAKALYRNGTNLMKMNITLMGGNTINYEGMISEAKEQIEKLETELQEVWTHPPDFDII